MGARRVLAEAYQQGRTVGGACQKAATKSPAFLHNGSEVLDGTPRCASVEPVGSECIAEVPVRPASAPSPKCQAVQDEVREAGQMMRRILGMNKRKKDKAKDLFKQWDPDDVGSVPIDRFVRGLRTLSSNLELNAAHTIAMAVDIDGDGYITRDQFVAWLLDS